MKRSNPRTEQADRTTIDSFALQIGQISADVVVMENVAALRSHKRGRTLKLMLDALARHGYRVNATVLNAVHYGVAQIRKRLVIIAARDAFVPDPPRTHCAPGLFDADVPSIGSAIGDLKPLAAGERDPDDPLHRARPVAPLTLERIKATPEGGDWTDWPPGLRECIVRPGGMFRKVYGRSLWGEPSQTLTTRFTSASNGCYIHPRQDRAFTFREGARLQGFADDFPFVPRGERFLPFREELHIGNAVPPPLAEAVARQVAGVLGF